MSIHRPLFFLKKVKVFILIRISMFGIVRSKGFETMSYTDEAMIRVLRKLKEAFSKGAPDSFATEGDDEKTCYFIAIDQGYVEVSSKNVPIFLDISASIELRRLEKLVAEKNRADERDERERETLRIAKQSECRANAALIISIGALILELACWLFSR